jgi:protein-S-isoprenylcysteine O-methyltransferase Ste14
MSHTATKGRNVSMAGLLAVLYGIGSYVFFLGTLLYAIGFVGNVGVPKTIDSGPAGSVVASVLVDALLLGLFAVQHSVMARPGFKRWWTRLVPQPIERSTYVLFASTALALLFWQWRPLPEPVWTVHAPLAVAALHAVFWLAWGMLFVSTCLLSHFELFGLRQVFARLRGTTVPGARFHTPGLYRHVRHPIYLSFLLAFWSTPAMTAGHLLFAVATTGYILIGIQLEERDLIALFGNQYRRYRRQVSMLVPLAAVRRSDAQGAAASLDITVLDDGRGA